MSKEVTLYTHSEEETRALGRFIGEHAEENLFLALSGDLGAGKTHFVQGLAEGMGVEGPVTSPTFNLMNIYEGRHMELKHFDFYRLDSEEDLYNIGWEEYSVGGVTVAEWADLFPSLIPEEAFIIHIDKGEGVDERIIHISWTKWSPASLAKEIQAYVTGN